MRLGDLQADRGVIVLVSEASRRVGSERPLSRLPILQSLVRRRAAITWRSTRSSVDAGQKTRLDRRSRSSDGDAGVGRELKRRTRD